ncbi:Uncharacterised protein [BD1-7 clade bacterium]|uniref:G8 domain-containing protein n=1 Tax=BD1-7 clade bacterium TaxID=2029982 RepID=A0A5S9PCP0_9GAMM|nr:Uncharacterised protein [BD1-7 clade bacterium]CAA0101373.1 Uncharacterised protein [BD1-7 clade bacterium]
MSITSHRTAKPDSYRGRVILLLGALLVSHGCSQSVTGTKEKAPADFEMPATSTSLTNALGNSACLKEIDAASPNKKVPAALFIDASTPCSNVTISASDTAALTPNAPLIPVVIGASGVLTLVDPGVGNQMSLHASSFLIKNGGTLQSGSVDAPIQGQIDIIMAGDISASKAPTANGSSPIVTQSNEQQNARDITVMAGGNLKLYGAKGLSATPDGTANDPASKPSFINTLSGTRSWTYLAKPAGPSRFDDSENVSSPVPTSNSETTLTLATTVDWQPKDWISVATTSFTSHQTEIVQICSIKTVDNPETGLPGAPATVSEITLNGGQNCTSTQATPLKHYHYGGLAPTPGFYSTGTRQSVVTGGNAIDVSNQAKSFYDDHTRNFGIDERAEVALLSRNIKFSSVATDDFMGGHLVVMHGDTAATIDLVGVEFEKFGQPFVGRYPIHLHHLKDTGDSVLVQDVSVHHSYNKCFVVHETGESRFYNNVCVRTVGQGVYLEDGVNITGNAFMRNHVAGTMAAQSTYTYPLVGGNTYWNGDYLQASQASASWYTINNITDTSLSGANAAGSNPGPDTYHPGGFWITNINNTFVNNSVAGCQAQGRGYWLLMQGAQPSTAYPEFTGNRAHGCYNGLDTAPDGINNASNPYPIFDNTTYPVSNASDTGTTITSSVKIPSHFPQPFSVTISGTDAVGAGPWSGKIVNNSNAPYSFSFDPATKPNNYSKSSDAKWTLQTMPILKVNKLAGEPIMIKIPNGIPVMSDNASVVISKTGTAADGTWTVIDSSNSGFTLKGSSSASAFTTDTGQWQLQGDIATMQSNPIVITTTSDAVTANPLADNDVITISGVEGNTNTNGQWKITYPAPGFESDSNKFALQGSVANASYTRGGTWQTTPQPPVLILNNNTITRSRNRGFWGRSIFLVLHNNRFATNPYGVLLAGGGGPEGNYVGYWDLAHRNVFAGMTRNNVERYPTGCIQRVTDATNTNPIVLTVEGPAPEAGSKVTVNGVEGNTAANSAQHVSSITSSADGTVSFTLENSNGKTSGTYTQGGMAQYNSLSMQAECTDVELKSVGGWGNYPNPFAGSVMNLQGYSYYDGPARIESNRFVNFRFDPTGIYPSTPEARLLTKKDIDLISTYASQGQLHGTPSPNTYTGYPGDSATGWIQSNAQTVPPTQYIKNSIWDNTDLKHLVYTEAVNMGAFNDGDKTTVILDKDSRLSGLKVIHANGANEGQVSPDYVPVSLNSIDYYATDYTVDEPHARGPNNFRQSSLMSPHKYATLNIESATNPDADFRVRITRDMPAYGDTEYPSLFLNGRGQKPIYEPFVMDRMGYTITGLNGVEHKPAGQHGKPFMPRLVFSYTDPAVKQTGEYFINRIAVSQPLSHPEEIKLYRIRRQWGQPYLGAWPPNFNPPGPVATSCDSTFFSNQDGNAPDQRWKDCVARGQNKPPPQPYKGAPQTYSGGSMLSLASSFDDFEKPYTQLLAGSITTADFIQQQTYYYDEANNMLYFYMIEDKPIMQLNTPYGTCSDSNTTFKSQVKRIKNVKTFSDTGSVEDALNTACLVKAGVPTATDLVTCSDKGCAAYLVDLTKAGIETPSLPAHAAITSASNTSPIVIKTSGTAPATGSSVAISGVTGNTNANGTWVVTKISEKSFSLDGSTGNGVSASGQWYARPSRPITRAEYKNWNQYKFVYATPTQQANGLPMPTGSDAPPRDGSPLQGMTQETNNVISYRFLPILGLPVSITENFPYTCLTTPPSSPVNPRGVYPPAGGFKYPLTPLACADQ